MRFNNFLLKAFFAVSFSCLLASCMDVGYREPSAQNEQSPVKDGAPLADIDVSTIADAVPRLDPVTRAGNKNPYSVNDKTYHLLPTAKGYREVGIASWYGTKFHGRKTANGEPYSLYGMTAAHTTLPIPSYVRVRNMANGRSVIVRINDRGPFHSDRIIDLSYAAAKKLGYSDQGTARVEVTAIDPLTYQKNSVQAPQIEGTISPSLAPATASIAKVPPRPVDHKIKSGQALETASTDEAQATYLDSSQAGSKGLMSTGPQSTKTGFLQVGVYASYQSATQHRQQVSGLTTYPVLVEKVVHPVEKTPLYKVIVGPVNEQSKLLQLRDYFKQSGSSGVFVVYM